jgi:hypothetical protein
VTRDGDERKLEGVRIRTETSFVTVTVTVVVAVVERTIFMWRAIRLVSPRASHCTAGKQGYGG